MNDNRAIRTVFLAMALLTLGLWHHPSVEALPFQIVAAPQNTAGGFTNNVFHTPHNSSGAGSILAFFDLDFTETNTYDPVTGELIAHFNIFDNSTFDNAWGSAVVHGFLPAADFNGNTGDVIGNIDWVFDLDAGNALSNHLDGLNNITTTYLDKSYTTAGSDTVNSWNGDTLFLWGADGYNDSKGYFKNSLLGTDIVLQIGDDPVITTTSTPEPMTMALLGSGFLGLLGFKKRKLS